MSLPSISVRALALIVAGATLPLSGTPAFAQTTSTRPRGASAASRATVPPILTVRAARSVRHQIVRSDYAGIPIEKLSLTREIGYHDLNLDSPQGIVTLRRRIDMTARNACRQLSTLYVGDPNPSGVWTTTEQACVDNAIQGALVQLPSSLASAIR